MLSMFYMIYMAKCSFGSLHLAVGPLGSWNQAEAARLRFELKHVIAAAFIGSAMASSSTGSAWNNEHERNVKMRVSLF